MGQDPVQLLTVNPPQDDQRAQSILAVMVEYDIRPMRAQYCLVNYSLFLWHVSCFCLLRGEYWNKLERRIRVE